MRRPTNKPASGTMNDDLDIHDEGKPMQLSAAQWKDTESIVKGPITRLCGGCGGFTIETIMIIYGAADCIVPDLNAGVDGYHIWRSGHDRYYRCGPHQRTVLVIRSN